MIKIFSKNNAVVLVGEDNLVSLYSAGDIVVSQVSSTKVSLTKKGDPSPDVYDINAGEIGNEAGVPDADIAAFIDRVSSFVSLNTGGGGGGTAPDYSTVLSEIEANTFDTNDVAMPALQASLEDLLKRAEKASASQSTSLTLANPNEYQVLLVVRRKSSKPDNMYKVSSVTMKELTSRGGEFKLFKNPSAALPIALTWEEVGGDSCLEYALGDGAWSVAKTEKAMFTTNLDRRDSRTDAVGDNRQAFGNDDLYILACKPTLVPAAFRSGLNFDEIV